MFKSIRNRCVILVLALLLAGCAKPENILVKEQIAILEKKADLFGRVTDKSSYEQIQPEYKVLSERIVKIDEELITLGAERRRAALAAHKVEMDQAMARMSAAKTKATKLAFGDLPKR
jgi:hypothetical protein